MRVGVALLLCLVVLASRLGAQRPDKAVPVSPQELAQIALLRPLNDPSRPASRYVVTTVIK
jgi:hypothetical protein